MKKSKRLISLLLAAALTFSLVPAAGAFSYTQMQSELGIRGYEITTVAPGVQHINLRASNASGNQNIQAVEFDPKSEDTVLRAGKSQGYVWSTQTVNTIANNMSDAESGGDVAVAAINGDYFTFGVGVPHGIFIEDGIILSTPPQYYAAFGLTYDNEPFIVRHGTILDKEFRINGSLVNVAGINMAHTKNAESIMLYTEEYARGTKTGSETYELRCRINSGEVRHGSTLSFTVEEINDATGNTTLGDGYVVLSAQGAQSIGTLKQLSVGDTLEMSFRFNEFWANVKFAIGGIELLLKDGEIYSTSDSSNQPRTSIGIRPDGTVVMATIDGRNAGGAVGMSYKTAAQAMRALGCVDALNLDGGGSTTFVLRKPGEMKTSVVNNVSGGSSRQVANALVLMNTLPTLSYPSSLTISPKSRLCFAGGTYSFAVTGAYDENYKPHKVPADIAWEIDSSINGFTENGELTAAETGKFTVTAIGGGASGTAELEIVSHADSVTVSETELTVKPGDTFELTASATLGGKQIEAGQDLFSWEAPGSLGEFTAPGKFKVYDNAVSGEIRIGLGDAVASVKVNVETPPVVISGFEDNKVSFVPVSVGTKVAPGVAEESILKFAHTGNRSLKVYYNFLNTTTSVGSYYMVSSNSVDTSAYRLSNAPKKLGMMVYGDASGVELRSIVEEESGKQHTVSYGKIEHSGWKYMTANIPEGISGQVFVKVPVYLVSNPSKLTQGTLYFDGLTAIYTEKNLDTTSPSLTKAWPENGQWITTATPSIGIVLSDASGIDENSIELYIDGIRCNSPGFDAASGKLSYTVKNELANGGHSFILFARDKVGNPIFYECLFGVRK